MSVALTKIQPPRPRAGLLLPRPALERVLVSALSSQRAVLVCAPAGYGKTAALGRALDQLPAGQAHAWVSLDPGDDLHRLLECLIAALEPYDPPWRQAPEGLAAAAALAGDRARQALVDALVNTLEACEVPHGVIVLDDFHHVDDPACLAFVDLWLQRLGTRWTLAIASRHEPPLRLARLRAAGELAEIRQAALRFGPEEARALLGACGLDPAAADALYARTDGWAAGLRLAVNGARGGTPGGAIDRPAFDFLATEVLERIDPALRRFLLATSVLQDLDEARCTALTDDPAAARRLEEIERLGLFATEVDAATRTLRLHDLFRDALQHRLRLEDRPTWLALCARAATIEPDPVRRQALFLAAERPDDAARALQASAAPLITEGGVKTLLRLIEGFPAAFAETSAALQSAAGMAKWNVWEARQAERHYAKAEALYAAAGDAAAAQVARGHHAVTLVALGRLAEAQARIDALDDDPPPGEAAIVGRLARTWHALEDCRFNAVAPNFERLVQALEAAPSLQTWFFTVPAPRLTACPGVGPVVERWAAGALALAGDRPVPLRALALLARGGLALWQGRMEAGAQLLARAEVDAQWTGQQIIGRAHSLALNALLWTVRGESERAVAAMRARLEEHAKGYGEWGLWHTYFYAGRVAAAGGDVATMRAWVEELDRLGPSLPDAHPARLRPAEALHGTLAWLEGRPEEAMARWQAALVHEEAMDLAGQANEVRARLAAALAERGRRDEAAVLLAPMLQRAADGPRGALFAGPALRALAGLDWSDALAPAQRATLERWAAIGAPAHPAAPAPSIDAATPAAAAPARPLPEQALPAERLSARELEVLAFIARGESNKLIARALDLSPHTVKRHVAHILEKLDLASRGQAAAWYHVHGAAGAPTSAAR